jgi:hypothetical protein
MWSVAEVNLEAAASAKSAAPALAPTRIRFDQLITVHPILQASEPSDENQTPGSNAPSIVIAG